MGDTEHLLDEKVLRLGGPIGCARAVVGQDLRAPLGHGLGQPVQLGHGGRLGLLDEGVEAPGRLGHGVGPVHPAKRLLGQPGVEHLVSGVTGGQAGLEAGPGVVAQAFVAPQQQAADAVERIPLAAPMAALVLLDPATDIVDGHVGQADGVEGIDDEGAWASLVATPLA